MTVHISLSTPPWEKAKPKPPKRKRYPRRAFPKGTPQVEKYWRKGQITNRQFAAAAVLMKANTPARSGYSFMQFRPRVDGGTSLTTEDMLTDQLRVQKLCRAIPPEYYIYVLTVVLEDRSIKQVRGCSGGINFKRYLSRLGLGLDALHAFLDLCSKRTKAGCKR